MSNIIEPPKSSQAMRKIQRAEFTLYRKGSEVFTLESRRQGLVRKVTHATFREEIMTDDSIKVTVLSSVSLDFKLRDYIMYDGKPYILNRTPEVSIDTSGYLAYTMTFEGAMFELGRVAFIIPDAYGYDYYGTLPEFARLVVDNMNRANEVVEWQYNGNTYKAKYSESRAYQGTTYYYWSNGKGNTINVHWLITTSRHPSVGEHGYSPIGAQQTSVVTSVNRWLLDFPKATTQPAVYPSSNGHIEGTDVITQWSDGVIDDYMAIIADYEGRECLNWDDNANNGDGQYLDMIVRELYSYIEWEVPLDSLNRLMPVTLPTFIGEIETRQNKMSFWIRERSYQWDEENGRYQGPVTTKDKPYSVDVDVRFTGESAGQSNWEIDPVTPPSGALTENDYPTESVMLSYDSHSCLSVLQNLVTQEEWKDWEWRVINVKYDYACGQMVVGGTIKMERRKAVSTPLNTHVLGFGKSGGLSSIKRKYSDGSNIPSRIYFYGGTQNLPQYYRNERLCLPNKSKEESYIDFAEMVGTSFPLGVSNTLCEEIRNIDDVYPACKPFTIGTQADGWYIYVYPLNPSATQKKFLRMVIPASGFFDIAAKWEDYGDGFVASASPSSAFQDYSEWLILKGEVEDNENKTDLRMRYQDYYSSKGVSKYMIGGQSPMVTFQTGALAGYSLSVHKCSEHNGNITLDLNVCKETNEEISDYYVPNAEVCCQPGDKFVVGNINMPVAYTYYNGGDQYDNNHQLTHHDFSAEYALLKAAIDAMNTFVEKTDYEIEIARDYVVKRQTVFHCFETVRFTDILKESRPSVERRISSVELDLVDGYTYKLTISNRGIQNPVAVLADIIQNEK